MQIQHVVDNLLLIHSIGKGNFGEVFLTQRKGRPEFYATKKMERAIFETPENQTRLLYEIDIIKSLNHPYIVKFCGLKKTLNNWYLITEFCNGGSLLSNLKKYINAFKRPFSEEIVQHFMKQIVSALQYLHFNKIIHRDLKLDNILLNFPSDKDKNSLNMMSATCKIIDFGFATRLNKPLTFTALGTPSNMDPAILENIKTGIPNAGYNEKVDIWSLGTLCYQMVVGHMPFSGSSMDELFEKVKKGTYKLPLTLSKEIVSFINGMLQQDPNKRLDANNLLYHDFLVKSPSQFHPIDVRDIEGSIGPGGVINMKSASNPQPINNEFYQLWGFFNQIGMYQPTIPQTKAQVQIQPQMQIQHQMQIKPQIKIQPQTQIQPQAQILPVMQFQTTVQQYHYGIPQQNYYQNQAPPQITFAGY